MTLMLHHGLDLPKRLSLSSRVVRSLDLMFVRMVS